MDPGGRLVGMRRADWTPLVLITASISVTVVAAVLLTTPWLRAPWDSEPGPVQERRFLAEQVQVWVGDLAPGVVGLLGPVWGQIEPDRAHDTRLNQQLGLEGDGELAWYHLLLFNRSDAAQTVSLADGALTIRPPDGADPVALRSLAGLVARGEARVAPSLAAVLAARGALSETVEVPAHTMADLLVAFDRRVALDQAVDVTTRAGVSLRRRPKTRRDLDELVEDPTSAGVEDL